MQKTNKKSILPKVDKSKIDRFPSPPFIVFTLAVMLFIMLGLSLLLNIVLIADYPTK